MSKQESAEIKIQINSIGAVYKQQSVSFMTPNPPIPKMPEMEPDHVSLNLTPLVDEIGHNGGSITVERMT
jgi:hypothetical protein